MRFLSVFSGVGGLDLGLEWAGWSCVGMCEQDEFCRSVLAHNFPGVPICGDVRDLTDPPEADAFVGGFPCQDISTAGKGAGIDGERSGLWSEFHRLIRGARPRWVIAENVPALRNRGADRVLGDLEGEGYTCWPLVVGARHVGAPHRRDRVFIVAHRGGERSQGFVEARSAPRATQRNGGATLAHRDGERCNVKRGAAGLGERDADGCDATPGALGDTASIGCGQGQRDIHAGQPGVRRAGGELADAGCVSDQRRGVSADLGSSPREAERDNEQRQRNGRTVRDGFGSFPPARDDYPRWRGVLEADLDLAPALAVERQICRVADGVPERLGRRWRRRALRALGNAVVPQVGEAIGRAILRTEAA